MRKLVYFLLLALVSTAFWACNNEETYADKVKRQRSAIQKYVADSAVKVISEAEFAAKGYTTDVSKNEFVLFESSGVYMQIVRQGTGKKLGDGENATLLCRYIERNLLADSITATNMLWAAFGQWDDQISVTNHSGTFTGYFVTGHSTLMTIYNSTSTSVPSAWLLPLSYIKLGRQNSNEELARVRLIVPHDMGTSFATLNVVPCLYDIIYNTDR